MTRIDSSEPRSSAAPDGAPGPEQGRCLVTGGAGFLGINLVRLLLARGVAVRSLDIAPFDYPERDRVEAVLGDIRDPATVAQAMRGVASVVHCAAALPLASDEEIRSTDVEGTRLLLDAAWRQGLPRFVFISSTAVYGVPDHEPIVEGDTLHGVGPYGQAKIDAEALCAAFRERGLCVPVLRPKSFVGPERLGAFELLYDWAASGHGFPVLGDGSNRYQLLDVEDLCKVIWLCLTRERALVDDTFNVGAAEFGSMRDNVQAVLDHAGHGRRVRALPRAPAVAVLRLLRWLRLSPLYPWIYESASHDSVVAIARLQARLGFTPCLSNRQALQRNYDWYLTQRASLRGRSGVSHRVPWKHGALALAKWLF
ncbi:MAG: epimerase [Leptothrix sp. (in: Bacteria)]|nr:epimerase [Leptothrix sp. (in: b-proteobacteria)]